MQQPPQWGQQNPYQPPGGYGAPPPQGYYPPQQQLPGSPYDYKPLGWRTTLASISIGGAAVGQLAVTAMLPLISNGDPNLGVAALVGILSLGSSILLLAAAVFFFIWTYTASSNARGLGNELLQITPGWTIGWWFIPFANLVMPYRSIAEIWRSSNPDARKEGSTEWTLRAGTPLVGLWWAAYLTAGILATVNIFMQKNGHVEAVSYVMPLVTMILRLFAAVMIILVMTGVTRRQQQQATMLGAG